MNNTNEKKRSDYKTYGLDSPIARTLDVVGDRWTLLIIRDLLEGHTKYQDLLDSLQGISTNLLAERLNRLERREWLGQMIQAHEPGATAGGRHRQRDCQQPWPDISDGKVKARHGPQDSTNKGRAAALPVPKRPKLDWSERPLRCREV